MTRNFRPLTVSDVARRTGVSARTLQYYDDIGLLVADRSSKGYRLYGQEHLLRLQQILVGRSFGQSLEDIRKSLDDPEFDQIRNLKAQRRRLEDRLEDTHRVIASIDEALAFLVSEKETEMNVKNIFDGIDPTEFDKEVRERWGETPSYAESQRRFGGYSKADWATIKSESDAIFKACGEAAAAGLDVGSQAAAELVERHRNHIDRWYYPCSPDMHIAVAGMWETDDRFQHNMDQFGEGTTAWLVKAIRYQSST